MISIISKNLFRTYFLITSKATNKIYFVGSEPIFSNLTRESLPDTGYLRHTPRNIREALFFRIISDKKLLQPFYFDPMKNSLIKTADSLEYSNSRNLVFLKYKLFGKIIYCLNLEIKKLDTGIIGQEFTYLAKLEEANKILTNKTNIHETNDFDTPLLSTESKEKNQDIFLLAQAVINKNKLATASKNKIEIVRNKYFNMVKNANSENEINNIENEFMRLYNQNI